MIPALRRWSSRLCGWAYSVIKASSDQKGVFAVCCSAPSVWARLIAYDYHPVMIFAKHTMHLGLHWVVSCRRIFSCSTKNSSQIDQGINQM